MERRDLPNAPNIMSRSAAALVDKTAPVRGFVMVGLRLGGGTSGNIADKAWSAAISECRDTP